MVPVAHGFLETIAMVLGVAAVTTVVFQWLRQPVVLGYVLAGLLVGPHLAFPMFADAETIHTVSELGVILLMFSLGLKFRLKKLVELGPTAGLTAVIQCSIMIWLGFVLARSFGWTPLEAIFTGAILAISSTTIIAKAFDEQGIGGRVREFVVGILIVEDLIAVLMMTALTAIASGSGLDATALALTTGRLALFLLGLVAVGLLVVPRAVRAVVALRRPETIVVASIGLCFAIALLALAFGYSVALGAFIAGSLVAESGHSAEIEHLVEPVKDVFAAIFFVSVGMMIDPVLVARHAWPIAVLMLVVIAGKVVGVSVGAFLTGNGTRLSIQSGMSLAQIGEFSFIIAGLGLSLRVTSEYLYPVVVAVSAITTLTTPWLIRASGPVASYVDRRLPHRLQTFATLYGSWIERLRTRSGPGGAGAAVRRVVGFLVLDLAVVIGIVITVALAEAAFAPPIADALGVERRAADLIVEAAGLVVALPFLVGLFRVSRRLGGLLAQVAFPSRQEPGLDFAAAPRRALRIALELGILLLVGLPVLAVTQPFVGGFFTPIALAVAVALVSTAVWRSATDLQGHVRAGSQAILELLAAQSGPEPVTAGAPLAAVEELLPGLGSLARVEVSPGCPGVGRTLAELDLRGLTGATVIAIHRGQQAVSLPTAQDVLHAGDVVALAGTDEAVATARALLQG